MKTTLCVALLGAALLAGSPAQAAKQKSVPAQQMIAAIQAAVDAAPGEVKEAEVEHKHGQLVIEVKIIGTDGIEKKVYVDPQSGQVQR